MNLTDTPRRRRYQGAGQYHDRTLMVRSRTVVPDEDDLAEPEAFWLDEDPWELTESEEMLELVVVPVMLMVVVFLFALLPPTPVMAYAPLTLVGVACVAIAVSSQRAH